MFRTVLLSAFGAALGVGVALIAVQSFTTLPLIAAAEIYEKAPPAVADDSAGGAADAHDHGAAWEPADGLERTLYTLLADFVVALAVTAILIGLMAATGVDIGPRTGIIWGFAGFLACALLPSLGLPPELPGTQAAGIAGRQAWWLGTAVASAGGLAALALGRNVLLRGAGIVLLLAPHAIGAPEAPGLDASYPAALAGEFVAASLVVSALLWSLSGLAGGWLFRRFSAAR